jgi:hypothetical protein
MTNTRSSGKHSPDVIRTIGSALSTVQQAYNNVAALAKEMPAADLVKAALNTYDVLGHLRSVLFALDVKGLPSLFYHEGIDGWIQVANGVYPNGQPTFSFSLTNNDPKPTSGSIDAQVSDYNPGINGPQSTSLKLAATNGNIVNLVSGGTATGELAFEGAPSGLYNLEVAYYVTDGLGEQLTFNKVTRTFERSGGTYAAAAITKPYLVPGDRATDLWAITSLMGITVAYGPPGCLTAQGTSRDGQRHILRVTTSGSPTMVLSEVTHITTSADGSSSQVYRVRTQLFTFSNESNGRKTAPNYSVVVESGPAGFDDSSGFRNPNKSLTLNVTPGREGMLDEMWIEGFYKKDSTQTPAGLVWYFTKAISGYLSSGVYQPNPGIDPIDFGLQALFADEMDSLSFFASVLAESDYLTFAPPPVATPQDGLGRVDQALNRDALPQLTVYSTVASQSKQNPLKVLAIGLVAGLSAFLLAEIAAAAAIDAAVAIAEAKAAAEGLEVMEGIKLGKIARIAAIAGRDASRAYRFAAGIVTAATAALAKLALTDDKDYGQRPSGSPQQMPAIPSMPSNPSMPAPWQQGPMDCNQSCPEGSQCIYGQCVDMGSGPVDMGPDGN